MKPARSPQVTSSLPSRRTRASTSSTTSGSVTTVRTTSASFMTVAGLKKCTPTTREGRAVATEISVTDSAEVLVARTVSGGQMASSRWKTERLSSRSSGTASTTSSAAARSSRAVLKATRSCSSAASASVSLPRLTARATEACRWPRPRARPASSTSTPMTLMPLRAMTSAIPAPIVPRPTTPTVVNSRGMGIRLLEFSVTRSY